MPNDAVLFTVDKLDFTWPVFLRTRTTEVAGSST